MPYGSFHVTGHPVVLPSSSFLLTASSLKMRPVSQTEDVQRSWAAGNHCPLSPAPASLHHLPSGTCPSTEATGSGVFLARQGNMLRKALPRKTDLTLVLRPVCVWIPGWFEMGHVRGWTQLMKYIFTAQECQHFPASGTLQTEMQWYTKPSGVHLDFNFFEYYIKRAKELKFELNACEFGIATWSRIWMSSPPRTLVVGEDR